MTHLEIENETLLTGALDAMSRNAGDFSDHVIREHGRKAGCLRIATFDNALLRQDGFFAP